MAGAITGPRGISPSFTESDPQWAAASNSYYTAAQADARFSTGTPLYVESDALYAASVAAQITATHTEPLGNRLRVGPPCDQRLYDGGGVQQ
jgi:hypothetical protein